MWQKEVANEIIRFQIQKMGAVTASQILLKSLHLSQQAKKPSTKSFLTVMNT
jgi:hypothetical protein